MSAKATRSRLSGWLLAAPALALLAVAFLWPMLRLARISLNETSDEGAMIEAFSLATYRKLASDSFTWQLTVDSLALSAFAATLALVLCYPMALYLFRTKSALRGLLTIAAVAPLLVSGTARVVGWLVILGDHGLINSGLAALGLPRLVMINNITGVRIGLTESVMPYTVLALIAGFGRLDQRLEEAAATLGASPLRSFWRVTFPLTLPAVSAAWLLAFALSVSAFITPHLMGGGRVFVLATEIYDAATQTLDWPAAAALSVYALILLVALAAAHSAVTKRLVP